MNQVSYDNSHASLSYIYIFPIAPSDSVQNVMISNVTDVDDIAVSITWDPPTDPNGIIRYYRVEFMQASDPLADTSDPLSGGRRKRNIPLDTTVMNEFANITNLGAGPPTSVTLQRLG